MAAAHTRYVLHISDDQIEDLLTARYIEEDMKVPGASGPAAARLGKPEPGKQKRHWAVWSQIVITWVLAAVGALTL